MPTYLLQVSKFIRLAPLAIVFLWSEASSQVSELPRLLLARERNGSCSIEIWHPVESKPHVLATAETCPEGLFVSNKTLLFSDSNTISKILLSDRSQEATSQALPNLDFDVHRANLSVKPNDDDYLLVRDRKLTVMKLGHFPDGHMGLQARLEMATNDSFNYLFKLTEGEWSIHDSLWCNGIDDKCTFAELHSQSTDSVEWQESRQIWHGEIRENPYFVKEEMFDFPNDALPVFGTRLVFRIGIGQTDLTFTTFLDTASLTTYAFGVELAVDGVSSKLLSERQCSTNLADRFVLVEKLPGGAPELWSLESGESVFGPLVHAAWVDR